MCNKVVHLSEDSAEWQADSLQQQYGRRPGIYKCHTCTERFNTDIYHVGYLSDQAKRLPKQAKGQRRKYKLKKKKSDRKRRL